jgi:acetoacetate decarboxylase
MKREDILRQASMPIAGPSYPRGPYRFIDREYFIVTYESDRHAIREAVPEPLVPDGANTVLYEFIRMRAAPASATIRNPASSSPAHTRVST